MLLKCETRVLRLTPRHVVYVGHLFLEKMIQMLFIGNSLEKSVVYVGNSLGFESVMPSSAVYVVLTSFRSTVGVV